MDDYLKVEKSALFLIPIIALVCFIALIPNLDYPYPVHIDEWVHISYSNALLRAGDINYTDPFSATAGKGIVGTLEVGFHILNGIFYKISGLSWVDIVRWLPPIIFAFTALSAYVLARREGFGWEAALFACLVPTTVGIMGPAFFIPMAFCLPLFPLALFLIFNYRTLWSYLLLAVFVCFMIITHATSAVCFILIIIPCVLLYLWKEPKHGLILLLMGIVPFLVTLPWTWSTISNTAKSLLVQQPLPTNHDLPRILKIYGWIPFGVGLLGTFWLAFKGGIKNYSLVLGLLILVAMLAVFFTLHYGVDLIYLRGIIFTLLILGIIAGAGLMAIRNLKLPDSVPIPELARRVGYLLALALVVATLVIAIPSRMDTGYYHMIEEEDYDTFVWIRDNIGNNHQKAILDPWKATPFTAITEKYTFTRIHMGPDEISKIATDFLLSGCTDTNFLREHGITLVYTQEACNNPDLKEVHQWVYVLEEQ
ncbi:MAG: hypothetical protein JW762_03585 [Dehalococcoidales bacterium]|nr:hypothetical protein [Dehalococcoidales bacterium]